MNKNNIKYVHTNLIARDWRKLAKFYIEVLNCKPLLPERDLKGEWIDEIIGIESVEIKGMHLALPGYEENGPTLEIFEYSPSIEKKHLINQTGFAHLAFHVDFVEQVLETIIANGGSQLGKVIKKEFDGIGILTVVYANDPEGNIIEIQNWDKN